MHWERAHVNPMVALRTVAYGDRWAEAWPQITTQQREQARAVSAERRTARAREAQAQAQAQAHPWTSPTQASGQSSLARRVGWASSLCLARKTGAYTVRVAMLSYPTCLC